MVVGKSQDYVRKRNNKKENEKVNYHEKTTQKEY